MDSARAACRITSGFVVRVRIPGSGSSSPTRILIPSNSTGLENRPASTVLRSRPASGLKRPGPGGSSRNPEDSPNPAPYRPRILPPPPPPEDKFLKSGDKSSQKTIYSVGDPGTSLAAFGQAIEGQAGLNPVPPPFLLSKCTQIASHKFRRKIHQKIPKYFLITQYYFLCFRKNRESEPVSSRFWGVFQNRGIPRKNLRGSPLTPGLMTSRMTNWIPILVSGKVLAE